MRELNGFENDNDINDDKFTDRCFIFVWLRSALHAIKLNCIKINHTFVG